LHAGILFISFAATGANCWAGAACLDPGARSNTAAYQPGQPIPVGFGVSGPTDQDPVGEIPDQCKTFYFMVPPVNYAGKGPPGGWGGLVLTFDRQVDGASFIFDPNCPTPIDGVPQDPLNIVTMRFSNRSYGFLPTDSPVRNQQGQFYSVFVVTVMYDPESGEPSLVLGTVDAPKSFWQGKPKNQGFGFQGDDGFSALAPEPSYQFPLLLSCPILLFLWMRRRHAPADRE
jgi:hypothetical protein